MRNQPVVQPGEDEAAHESIEETPDKPYQASEWRDAIASIEMAKPSRFAGRSIERYEPPRQEEQAQAPHDGTSNGKGFHIEFHVSSP